jgi:hypothetical protein
MSNMLLTNKEWSVVDGCMCEVEEFTSFARVENGKVVSANISKLYGFVSINCKERGVNIPRGTIGAITHKMDFRLLWEVFHERGIKDNEQVVICWSKNYLRPAAKLFATFMPRIAVTIFETTAYRLLSEPDFHPEIQGRARFFAELPIAHWQPDIWAYPIISTREEF